MDWLYVVWGVAATALIGRGIYKERRRNEQLRQHGVQTQGVVVRNKFILGRVSVFRPVIRFATSTGEVVEAIDYSGWAAAFPRFAKGEKVRIIYEAGNPQNFKRI
jgi:hypothetical protein